MLLLFLGSEGVHSGQMKSDGDEKDIRRTIKIMIIIKTYWRKNKGVLSLEQRDSECGRVHIGDDERK